MSKGDKHKNVGHNMVCYSKDQKQPTVGKQIDMT